MSLNLIRVSERQLVDLCQTAPNIIRIGSTTRIEDRINEYRRLGYYGEMYYSVVESMRDCEDRCLLTARIEGTAKYNFYDQSIAGSGRGFVYAISGHWIE